MTTQSKVQDDENPFSEKMKPVMDALANAIAYKGPRGNEPKMFTEFVLMEKKNMDKHQGSIDKEVGKINVYPDEEKKEHKKARKEKREQDKANGVGVG